METTVLESLFNKVASLYVCNIEKETPTQVFSCAYCTFLSANLYLDQYRIYMRNFEICERLLLIILLFQ